MGQQLSTKNSEEIEIKTPIGKFVGLTLFDVKTNKPLCNKFSKIRYALPPVGENRWKKPLVVGEDYDHSKESYDNNGPACFQPHIKGKMMQVYNNLEEKSEDCTYLNIWIPANMKTSPSLGLPVLFYIHGGWLQYGSPNLCGSLDPRFLLGSEEFADKYIIVSPGYRLNVLGFLSCKDFIKEGRGVNFGLWDQRAALEWTAKNIKYFGGDANKITVGGLSAGSYSTFFQLAYEIYHPDVPQIIKQVIHFSNCLSIQPKNIEEVEPQFDELCKALNIKLDSTFEQKLEILQQIKPEILETTITTLSLHTFRAVTDDDFISSNILSDIHNGTYGKKLSEKNIRIVIGEVLNEPELYSYLNTPLSLDSLSIELENYYPKLIIPTLLEIYNTRNLDEKSPEFKKQLRSLFGKIISDSQVYSSSRGFLNYITKGSFPKANIYRFKDSFIPNYLKKILDEVGVQGPIHGGDQCLWFFGTPSELSPDEVIQIVKFITPLSQFIHHKDIQESWGTSGDRTYRHFQSSGMISTEDDADWDKYINIAERIRESQVKA